MASLPPLLMRDESLAELRAKEVGPFLNPDGTLSYGDWKDHARDCSKLYKENIRTWSALVSFTNKELMADRCNCNVEPVKILNYLRFETKLQYAEFMIQMFVCSDAQIQYAPPESLTRLVRKGLDEFAAGYEGWMLGKFNAIQRETTENGLTQAAMAAGGAILAGTMGFAVGLVIAVILAVIFYFYTFNVTRRGREIASLQSEHAKSNLGKMVEEFAKKIKEPLKIVRFWNDHRAAVHDQLFRKTGAKMIYIADTGDEYDRGEPIPDDDTGFAGATAPDDEA
jgi:hypothetical protein